MLAENIALRNIVSTLTSTFSREARDTDFVDRVTVQATNLRNITATHLHSGRPPKDLATASENDTQSSGSIEIWNDCSDGCGPRCTCPRPCEMLHQQEVPKSDLLSMQEVSFDLGVAAAREKLRLSQLTLDLDHIYKMLEHDDFEDSVIPASPEKTAVMTHAANVIARNEKKQNIFEEKAFLFASHDHLLKQEHMAKTNEGKISA